MDSYKATCPGHGPWMVPKGHVYFDRARKAALEGRLASITCDDCYKKQKRKSETWVTRHCKFSRP